MTLRLWKLQRNKDLQNVDQAVCCASFFAASRASLSAVAAARFAVTSAIS